MPTGEHVAHSHLPRCVLQNGLLNLSPPILPAAYIHRTPEPQRLPFHAEGGGTVSPVDLKEEGAQDMPTGLPNSLAWRVSEDGYHTGNDT